MEERIGLIKYYQGRRLTASGKSLDEMWDPTSADIGTADLIVYMCNDTTESSGTVGIAFTGSACNLNLFGQQSSINEWRTTASAYGSVRQFSAVISFFY